MSKKSGYKDESGHLTIAGLTAVGKSVKKSEPRSDIALAFNISIGAVDRVGKNHKAMIKRRKKLQLV